MLSCGLTKKNMSVRFIFFLVVLFSINASQVGLFANGYGKVTGKIVDSEIGDPMIGANVFFKDTMIGAASDIDGNYMISKVPPGQYDLVVSVIGYAKKVITGVHINTGEVIRLDITLEPEMLESDEVVVSARMIRNTESALLKDRQKAVAVSDAISAEAISRSGSSDAADAMKKVTGASVVDGKYVYVRGLGERYSSTHLNGVELPTADPDKKAFQMDLFPSNLLENIVTIKTFTPDKPGNFSGGVVDIGTKTFPERFTLSVSTSSSFNSQTTFNDDYLLYPRGSNDWLAVDDGLRDVPTDWGGPGLVIPSAARARIDAQRGDISGAILLDKASKSFNNVMSPTDESPLVNQSYAISTGNQLSLFNRPFGYIGSITYNRNATFYDDGFVGRYSLGSAQSQGLNPELLLDDVQGKDEVSWGGLFNFGYKVTPNHKLSFNSLYSRGGESTARYQIGRWPKEFTLADTTNFFENRVLQYKERQLYSLQIRGEHHLKGLLGSTWEWSAATAQNNQDEPDLRYFANIRRITPNAVTYSASQSGFSDPSRYFRDLRESNRNLNLDVTVPFKLWSGLNNKFKFGGAYLRTDREVRERIFNITPGVPYTGDPDVFFDSANMGIIGVDTLSNGNLSYTFGNTVTDRTKLRNNYDGGQTISAAYGMFDCALSSRLRFIGGARYEATELQTVSRDSSQAVGRIDEKDLLPSINLVYSLMPEMNLRAAYTKTLARPTFREIAPFENLEFINGNFLIGNPQLKRTLIENFDLRWEWFLKPGEIVAVSGFYKEFTDPIERTIVGGTNGQIQYKNVGNATVYGIEFEVRKQFDFIHNIFRHFGGGVNLTLANSNIDIDPQELATRRAVDPPADATRDLQGQSPYLANVDLTYSNPERKTVFAVNFNTFGRRLSNVSLGGTPDVYERSRKQLDLTASQGIKNGLTFKLAVKNILNDSYKETYSFKNQEFVYYEYKLGRTYSIGLSYNL